MADFYTDVAPSCGVNGQHLPHPAAVKMLPNRYDHRVFDLCALRPMRPDETAEPSVHRHPVARAQLVRRPPANR